MSSGAREAWRELEEHAREQAAQEVAETRAAPVELYVQHWPETEGQPERTEIDLLPSGSAYQTALRLLTLARALTTQASRLLAGEDPQ